MSENNKILNFPSPPAQAAKVSGPFMFNHKSGQLEPIADKGLFPIGQVVSYGDQANDRKLYVVTGENMGEYGYGQTRICEDGHNSQVSRAGVEGLGGWQLEKEILTSAEIADFTTKAQARKEREDLERAQVVNTRLVQREEEKKNLLEKFSYLELAKGSKKSGHALGAANLRAILAREFPGVKFSVHSSYGSINASWNDGPTEKEVDAYADLFQECDFDGMTDSENSRGTVFPDLFGGAKYVFCNRHLPISRYQDIIDELGLGDKVTASENDGVRSADYTYEQMVCRKAREKSYYLKPEPKQAAKASASKTTKPEPVNGASGVTVSENEEKDGVEIRFASRPVESVLSNLKAHGWRWSRFAGCWYHRRDAETLAFASGFAGVMD